MIAGPILPRTAEGLWDVVRADPQRIENGLRIVRRELVLEGGLVVDALGADAVGRPVLVFAALVDRDRTLPSRIAEAREWFDRNGSLLQAPLDGTGLRVDLRPRVFVIGFDFTEGCLDRLRRQGDPDLFAFRVEGFYVDGVRHVGAVRVLGCDSAVDPVLGELASGPHGPFARRLADLLARLDPDLTTDGDPYARAWRLHGTTILRVERDARGLRALVPDARPLSMGAEDEVLDVFDAAARRYLDVLDAPAPVDRGELREERFTEPRSEVRSEVHSEVHPVVHPEVHPEVRAEELRDVGALRAGARRIEPEVTADEYEAFLDDGVRGGLS